MQCGTRILLTTLLLTSGFTPQGACTDPKSAMADDSLPESGQGAKPAESDIDELNNALTTSLETQLKNLPAIKSDDPESVNAYSTRGDLQMFLGRFAEAEADYQKMVPLKPELDVSHWRLGIAKYFAGHPEQAAGQFDRYHSFDNVDRENGIWRYLSHRVAFGKETAEQVGQPQRLGPGVHHRPLTETIGQLHVAPEPEHAASQRVEGLHDHIARK